MAGTHVRLRLVSVQINTVVREGGVKLPFLMQRKRGFYYEGILGYDPGDLHRSGRLAGVVSRRLRWSALCTGAVCGGRLYHWGDVRGSGSQTFQRGWLSRYLPEGADLPAGGYWPRAGCADHRYWQRAQDSSNLFLPIQRGSIPSGECRTPGAADPRETEDCAGAAP